MSDIEEDVYGGEEIGFLGAHSLVQFIEIDISGELCDNCDQLHEDAAVHMVVMDEDDEANGLILVMSLDDLYELGDNIERIRYSRSVADGAERPLLH